MLLSLLRSLLLFSCLSFGAAAQAAIIFSDDFSDNTPGLNRTPTGWSIANSGAVDIFGSCNGQVSNDLLPGNNCYVDLEGDDSAATGVNALLTKTLFLPSGHTYTAFYDLAGNNSDWPFADTVSIKFGTSASNVYLQSDDPFATYFLPFSPSVSGEYSLSFINSHIDGYGALLDNLRIQQVPGPLPLLGVGAALGFGRRLRARRRDAHRHSRP
jgi:hypothetical protein